MVLMLLLVLKLVLAPLLVAVATLAQRRFGPAVGGRLVGLPLTATPMLLLLALGEGPHFTAHVAVADQAGDVAASTWCLAYTVASRRLHPAGALAAASACFAVVAAALGHLHLGLGAATVLASTTLLAALIAWPRHPALPASALRGAAPTQAEPGETGPGEDEQRDDLLVRMLVAAAFTFAITESAAALGATVAGLLGAIPLVTVVLAVATHHRSGPTPASHFLQGVMSGSFSVIAFLAVLALALPSLGTAPAFALALGASVAAQATGARPVLHAGGRVRRALRPALRSPVTA